MSIMHQNMSLKKTSLLGLLAETSRAAMIFIIYGGQEATKKAADQ